MHNTNKRFNFAVSNTNISFMNEEITTKVCPKCGRELPAESFNKSSKSKDGLQHYCRECQHAMQKSVGIRTFKANNPLSAYTPRELIAELRARGYKGELTYTHVIKI